MTIGGRESKLIRQWQLYLLPLFVFLLPIIFLPFLADTYIWPKVLLVFIAVVISSLLWLRHNIKSRFFSLTLNPFMLVLLFLNLIFFLSAWLASGNLYLSILALGLPFLLGSLLFVVVVSIDLPAQVVRWSLVSAVLAGAALALVAIYQYFDFLSLIIPWSALADNKIWSPIGGVFNLLYYLPVSLIIAIILAWREKQDLKKVLYIVSSAVILIGLFLTLSLLFGADDKYRLWLLPLKTSWSIGLEVLKRQPLLGVGPGMFMTAFNRFREAGYNLTQVWNRQFVFAGNTPLHMLTETGFLGLAGWLVFWWTVVKVIRLNWDKIRTSPEGRILSYVLLASLVYQLLLPSTLVVWLFILLFLTLYILWLSQTKSSYLSRVLIALETARVEQGGIRGYRSGMALNLVAGLVLAGLLGLSGLFGIRYALAEYHFAKSVRAGAANDAVGLLRHLGQAINYYPWLPKYHSGIAQVHQQVINNILQKEAEAVTDEDRRQLQTSTQVALLQAKAAVQLNPNNANNWAALARLYTNLIGLAQGADQWAVATYQQALALDPVNPVLRTNLTGLLYSLGRLDEAKQQGQLAVQSKPDYANGWFNLALVYEKQKDYQQAHAAMQRVLQFLPLDSPDRQKAQEKLEELKQKIAETNPTPTPSPPPAGTTFTPAPTPVLTQPTPIPTVTATPLPVPESDIKPPLTITPTP